MAKGIPNGHKPATCGCFACKKSRGEKVATRKANGADRKNTDTRKRPKGRGKDKGKGCAETPARGQLSLPEPKTAKPEVRRVKPRVGPIEEGIYYVVHLKDGSHIEGALKQFKSRAAAVAYAKTLQGGEARVLENVNRLT
jgi:hypothetical protein